MEVKILVDIKDVERLTKQFPEASKMARVSRITEAVLLLKGEIKKATPVGAGPIHLRDTIFHKINMGGQSVQGLLGTPLEHGLPVEMGTKPHFPPVAPIQFWVEKKLGYSGKEAKSVAFLIARAISKRGTKGAHMFEKTFGMNESRVLAILNQIPADIIAGITK